MGGAGGGVCRVLDAQTMKPPRVTEPSVNHVIVWPGRMKASCGPWLPAVPPPPSPTPEEAHAAAVAADERARALELPTLRAVGGLLGGDAAVGGELGSQLCAMLAHYEGGGSAIYVHCWGGRGRAGLVGSALLALMWPQLGGDRVLEVVQRGYDSRAGASALPAALKRSPQTDAQRDFVRRFARDVGVRSGSEELGMYG